MGKNKKSWLEKNQSIVIVVILVAFAYYGFSSGLFADFASFSIVNQQQGQNDVPLQPETQFYQYNVTLSVLPSTICVGDTVVGTISSNIPSGVCNIYLNSGTGFNKLIGVNLNSNGSFSTTQTINTTGTAIFRAVCCDNQGNCRVSNDATLISNPCNQPVVEIECNGAVVPDGVGDAGGYCASLKPCSLGKSCDNYLNQTTMKQNCGCATNFFCQPEFEYVLPLSGIPSCDCPLGSVLVLGTDNVMDDVLPGQFKCTYMVN
jgi:hypothetical protein